MTKKNKIKLIFSVALPVLVIGGVILPLGFLSAQTYPGSTYSIPFSGWIGSVGNTDGQPSYAETTVSISQTGNYRVWAYYNANDGQIENHEEFRVLIGGQLVGQTTDPNSTASGPDYENEYLGEINLSAGSNLVRLEHAWNDSDYGTQGVYPIRIVLDYVETTPIPGAVLYIAKSVDNSNVYLEDDNILTYSFTYQNIGSVNATNVIVYDDYDESRLDVYDSAGGTVSGGRITWNVGSLSPGSVGAITFRLQVRNVPDGVTNIYNVGGIDSDQTGPRQSNRVRVVINNNCPLGPSVDIKANGSDGPITIPYDASANLTWTSSNVTSCYASDDWSGSKSTSGSESTGDLTSASKFTITCTGSGGTVSDSVLIAVGTSYGTGGTVAGATTVSTGLTNNFWVDSFVLPLAITLLVIWLFKSRIIKFEEWADRAKERYSDYKSGKLLKLKVAKIRAEEIGKNRE